MSRHQGTGYMLEKLIKNADEELTDAKMAGILSNLQGENIRSVTMFPSVKWTPAFNFILPQTRNIRIANYLGFIQDKGYEMALSGMPKYRNFVIREIKHGNVRIINDDPLSHGHFPTLAFLSLKAYYKHNPHNDPHYIATESFVSGGSTIGLVEAVSKMARSHISTRESPRRIMVAIIRWMKKKQVLPEDVTFGA